MIILPSIAAVAMNRKIRIVFIITGLDVGGAEMILLRLISKLSPRFEPYVISLSSVGIIGKRIRDLGVEVCGLNMKSRLPNPLAFLKLVTLIKRINPDVVSTWMYHANLIGGVASWFAGCSSIVWAIHHSNLSPSKNKPITLAVVRLCAWLSHYVPTKIVSCSEVARDIHIGVGYSSEKFIVIPNGIDLTHFKPDPSARESVRSELGLSDSTPLIGLIARFDTQKNHEGFVRSAGLLHAKMPFVHFLLAGSDVERSNSTLVQWVQLARIDGYCHLLGSRDDIPRIMAALDILTSSSWGEAFPNVVAEAMACGVPCVVTNVGDSSYIVGETGKTITAGNDSELVAAWESLLSPLSRHDRLVLGQRARTRVSENFELCSVVDRYEAVFASLASQ